MLEVRSSIPRYATQSEPTKAIVMVYALEKAGKVLGKKLLAIVAGSLMLSARQGVLILEAVLY